MRFLCLLFLLLNAQFIIAQNLVQNPSFEEHEALDCLSCYITSASKQAIMPHWNRLSSSPVICDCAYEKKPSEERIDICNFRQEPVETLDGCTMMEMDYLPSCLDWDHKTRGCAGYVATTLSEPMKMGVAYEVSFWIHLKKPDTPDYAPHIGFTLFPKAIRNPKNAMLRQNTFQIDTVIYNEWYKVSWTVQPTCPLQFLVIGVFKGQNTPTVNYKFHRNYYYLDRVSVKELNQEQLRDTTTFFCKSELKNTATLQAEIPPTICYFESNSDNLSLATRNRLDSFALQAKKQANVAFSIAGHTDSIGQNHEALSNRRIEQTLDYLQNVHQIPALRFIRFPRGASQPQSGTSLAENRRIEIHQLDYKIEGVVYRNLLAALEQSDIKTAFQMLTIWLHLAPQEKHILLLYDPRLEALQENPRWALIFDKIKKSYAIYPKPKLAFTLDSLWAADQKHRTLRYYIENLRTYIPDVDTSAASWQVHFEASNAQQIEHDQLLLSRFQQFLDNTTWFKISEVGKRGTMAAFFLIQHSNDAALMAHYLPLLKANCLIGESEWMHYALLYDRLQVLKNLPQRFGTQFKIQEDGSQVMESLEDASRVNEWRNELGLPPLSL